MRKFARLFLAIFLAALGACGEPRSPALGEPVMLELPGGVATGPRLSGTPDGGLVLSWMSTADQGATLTYATIRNGMLTEPRDVATDTRMFVNWADLPSVMQVDGDHWIAQWLRYSADATYSYDVVVAQSFDNGINWSGPITVHDDNTPTEHGFVSMYRAAGGVSLLWLDGRNTPDGPMTLRAVTVTPGGDLQSKQLIDDAVCDCCQTDIAISALGPVAVYRDRTADEIRDIYITRYAEGKWQPGARLHADDWNISGCPVNGPSIVASGDRVAVAWFTAPDNSPVVRVVLSTDGGANFGRPIEISAGRLAGYVGLAFVGEESLAISWVGRNKNGNNSLLLRTLSMDGTLGEVRNVAEIAQLRVFPRLGFQDNHVFLFWTDQAGDARQLRGAKVPLL